MPYCVHVYPESQNHRVTIWHILTTKPEFLLQQWKQVQMFKFVSQKIFVKPLAPPACVAWALDFPARQAGGNFGSRIIKPQPVYSLSKMFHRLYRLFWALGKNVWKCLPPLSRVRYPVRIVKQMCPLFVVSVSSLRVQMVTGWFLMRQSLSRPNCNSCGLKLSNYPA